MAQTTETFIRSQKKSSSTFEADEDEVPFAPAIEEALVPDNSSQDEWLEWGEKFADCIEPPNLRKPDSWLKLSNTLRQYDQDKIQDCKEDIDTLLVFAGLYSAILTAFIIEAYHLLQNDPANTSIQILHQISQQLGSFSVSPNFVNATLPPIPLSTARFQPAPGSVCVNALWFCSLVCSLVTASLGILVKQWLREYLAMDCIAAKERCRIRLFRRKGLVKYRVFELAAFLPFLLQISLVLFFIGLIEFIRPIHPHIGWAVTSLVALWIIFYISTTIAPAFSPSCPYKTPLLKSVLQHIRLFIRPLFGRIYAALNAALPGEEASVISDPSIDEIVLLDADTTFRDSDVFETIRGCITDCRHTSRPDRTFCQIIQQRVGRPLKTIDYRDLGSLTKPEMVGMAQTLAQYLRTFLRRCYDHRVSQPWNGGIEDVFTLMEVVSHSTPESPFDRLFEAFLLLPTAPASGALYTFRESAVKWMAGRPYQLRFSTVIVELMDQIILGAETILQTEEEGLDCILVWGVVCDFACSMSDSELSKLNTVTLRHIATVMASVVDKKPKCPVTPDFDLAIKCHGILDGSVVINRRLPGVVSEALLNSLDTLCLELFRTCVEAEGYLLTNWDELIREPSSPSAVYSSITFLESPNQDEGEDWRVRWLRASYSERRSLLAQFQRVPTPCTGGIVRKASVSGSISSQLSHV